MTGHKVLDTPLETEDSYASTIREHLCALLAALWDEKEEFDSKRPFGFSDWEEDFYIALGRAGLIRATFHEEEKYLMDCDREAADRLVRSAIGELAARR